VRIKNTKLWESSSYLLWTLTPRYDIDAEYGCLATHESLEKTETAARTLSKYNLAMNFVQIQ